MCYNIYFIGKFIILPFLLFNQFYITSHNFFLNTLYLARYLNIFYLRAKL
jgi:hypothetical protein